MLIKLSEIVEAISNAGLLHYINVSTGALYADLLPDDARRIGETAVDMVHSALRQKGEYPIPKSSILVPKVPMDLIRREYIKHSDDPELLPLLELSDAELLDKFLTVHEIRFFNSEDGSDPWQNFNEYEKKRIAKFFEDWLKEKRIRYVKDV